MITFQAAVENIHQRILCASLMAHIMRRPRASPKPQRSRELRQSLQACSPNSTRKLYLDALSADVVILACKKELVSFESLFPRQWRGFGHNEASDGNAADTSLEKESSRSTRFAWVKLRARPTLYNPRTVKLGRGSGHERSLHFTLSRASHWVDELQWQ